MIDELPDAPDPAVDSPAVFNAKAAASVLAQKRMVPQINAALAAIGALAAGGAFAIAMMVDASSTAAGDPGTGKLRFSSANQSAASTLYVDLAAIGGVDITAKLAQFGASTSAVKGTLRLVQLNDQTRELVCNVTAVGSPSGYRTLTVTPISSSAVAPFADGATVLMFFQRNGDKGDVSSTAFPTLRVQDRKAAGTGGGSAPGGVISRTLNTVVTNTIPGASLTANRVVLPAGVYKVTGSAPAFSVAFHQSYLSNFSGGDIVVLGTTEHAAAQSPFGQSRSLMVGEITLGAVTTLVLNTWTMSAQADVGLGANVNTGQVNIFSELLFEKVG